jgi:cyclophilin family peptidyl-prolyl cis-trans isomerase
MADGGRRLSGLIPLVVVIVIVVLFARSCFQRLDLGDETEPEGQDQGLGQVSPDGDDEDEGPAPATIEPQELEPRNPTCAPDEGEGPHRQWTRPPDDDCIEFDRDYTATLHTSVGDIDIELDVENAPLTVNNFVFLARWGYYDATDFDAVLPEDGIFGGLLRGPDGLITNPGYTIEDELPETDEDPVYPRYSVAMGNENQPDTSGSAFFIELRPDGGSEAVYSRFGYIEDPDSQAVVDEIEATGVERYRSDGTPPPGQAIVIDEVTITEH